MPARHWRVSCCFHIVPLGLPTAVAHMGKQTRRRDKPITPQSGWTPAGAPCSSSGPSPPRLDPHESLLEFPEMRIVWSQRPAERLYFAWKFDMVASWDKAEGGDFKLCFRRIKKKTFVEAFIFVDHSSTLGTFRPLSTSYTHRYLCRDTCEENGLFSKTLISRNITHLLEL